MHDGAPAYVYEPDTEVWDEPTRREPVALSRVTTDQLTVQVNVDGRYHRRIPSLSHTACELPIHSQFSDLRREELCHPLCRSGCFTVFELRLADERAAREAADE